MTATKEVCTQPSYTKEPILYQIDGSEDSCGKQNSTCPLANGSFVADGSMEAC